MFRGQDLSEIYEKKSQNIGLTYWSQDFNKLMLVSKLSPTFFNYSIIKAKYRRNALNLIERHGKSANIL